MTHWLASQWPSFVIAAGGYVTFRLAGDKKRSAWAIGLVMEVAWVAYAVWLRQYGFIVTSVLYAAAYWRNWRKWAPEKESA